MNIIKVLLILGISTLCFKSQFPWSAKLEAKVKSAVEKTYEKSDFTIEALVLTDEQEEQTVREMKNHMFAVKSQEEKLGYLYVGQTPSMKNIFDFAILFDNELEIKNAKVLIYRENHGRQVGTKRWLKQFFGLNPKDKPKLGETIDGIAGATISVSSMTEAIHDLLVDLSYLKTQNLFND